MSNGSRERSKGDIAASVVGIILCVIMLPVLVVNLTIIIKSFADSENVPDFLGYKPLIVLTGSMENEIYAGDLAIVKETDVNSLKCGDIIAFREGDSIVTHRIIEVTEQNGKLAFVTKGDANNTDDGCIDAGFVEGKFLFKISKLGNFAMFLQKPVGMIVFIGIPLILFILYDALRRRKYDRNMDKTKAELQAEIERLKTESTEKATSESVGEADENCIESAKIE